MRNHEINPIVYEYRYANLSDSMRNQIIENRYSLFERSTNLIGEVKKSSNRDTLIAKLGVISGIAIIGYIVSLLI
ncbi:MAG: hypothetical protein HKN68_12585 [Saprospiraceae bacterium]|nr:hypothetical protein [Saprospiraceae bacterium]